MDKFSNKIENTNIVEEKILKAKKTGIVVLIIYLALLAGSILTIVVNGNILDSGDYSSLNIVFLL